MAGGCLTEVNISTNLTIWNILFGFLDVPDFDIEPVPPMLEQIVAVDRALYSPGSIVVFDLETTGLCTFTIY